MILLYNILFICIGLAGGVAVGSAFVSFITLLNIVPRLIQLTKTFPSIQAFEYAIILGAACFTWLDFQDWTLSFPSWTISLIGIIMGIFIGMVAASLTEILNVLPILAKRLQMQVHLLYLLMAMVFGKIVGSLYQWFIFKG
jgi:stage V sporulation protein AB